MKESEPPQRRTPLPRQTKPIKRSSKPIRRSSRTPTQRAAFDAARSAVASRTWCEAVGLRADTGEAVCSDLRHSGEHAHHLWPEDRDAQLCDPARQLWLCPQAHAWAHNHPAQAKVLGLMRPTL